MDANGLKQLAAQKLAAIGDKFLSAFDDTDSDDERAPAHPRISNANVSTPQENFEAASDESGSYLDHLDSDSAEESDEGARVPVFEFDSKSVTQREIRRARTADGTAAVGTGTSAGQGSGGGRANGAQPAAVEAGVSTWTGSRSEVQSLQRQVQTYGAAALNKKSKQQFEAKELAKLGAKAAKAPKMAASVGKGLKRKQDVRAERAQEAAIEAGHTSRQAISKLKRRSKAAAYKPKRGLGEDNGAFRGGILRVTSQTSGPKLKAKSKRGQR